MLLPIAFILGFFSGAYLSYKKRKNKLDALQFGTVFGIIFVLISLVLAIISQRIGLI